MKAKRSWKTERVSEVENGASARPQNSNSSDNAIAAPIRLQPPPALLAMISQSDREKMLRAHSIGPRMIGCLAEIGIERLRDLKGADAEMLAMRIDAALGRKHMNRLGVEALQNLIALAEGREGTRDRNRDFK